MRTIDMPSAIQDETRRQLEICNACRYCEGFCAVFPAMMRRRAFLEGDMNYLANLCHNCKGCFHACQYAPPHAFAVNLPATLAELRLESYETYAWPAGLGRLFRRNAMVVAAVVTAVVALLILLTGWLAGPESLTKVRVGPGAFYRVIPWSVLAGLAGAAFLFAILVLAMGGVRFWKDVAGGGVGSGAVGQAAAEALTLRYLGGGHGGKDGCNDRDENFSQLRRRFHHLLFYGFALCFASTAAATLYDHFLALPAPYPLESIPVLLGLFGGIGMAIGASGLIWVKRVTDPAPEAPRVQGGEYAILGLLLGIAVTGIALLAFRATAAMGLLLAVHIGLVLSFFLLLPYSKMVHGLYRSLALLKNAKEVRETKEASSR